MSGFEPEASWSRRLVGYFSRTFQGISTPFRSEKITAASFPAWIIPPDFSAFGSRFGSDKNGKNKSGETFLFRYHEEDGNPVINNIEREDEYMAAAESFHNFIENLPHENEIDEEQDEDIFAE